MKKTWNIIFTEFVPVINASPDKTEYQQNRLILFYQILYNTS